MSCQGPFITAMFWPLFWALFQGHDEADLFRGAPRLTEACPRHEDKARLTGTRIYIILLLGSLRNDWLKRSLQNLIFGAVKHWPSPVALKNCWLNNPQLWSTCVMRRPFCVKVGERMYSALNHLAPLEHLETYLGTMYVQVNKWATILSL